MIDVLARRRAGVLLHPTSLPGDGDNGTLGSEARAFVDFLAAGGFSVWQTLPLGPADAHGSPYCLRSTQAGDVRLLSADDLGDSAGLSAETAQAVANGAPAEAHRSFVTHASMEQRAGLASFARRHRDWLLPYALFRVCERRFGGDPWWLWPAELRDPVMQTLLRSSVQFRDEFRGVVLGQYLFELQWSALKRYANEKGIYLFGDLPFYVDMHSVEVWWNRALFDLDEHGKPQAVAGVPPDYFSADGQLWGNPLYDWSQMQAQGFDWWVRRFAGQLRRFDVLRIDHFRALESYWAVPAGARTARDGEWRQGCGDALLARVHERLGALPLVAEDLGIITDAVRELRDRFVLPGMVVLQFAFDGSPDNPHLPEHHAERAVVYTGTHDNDTTAGWYATLDEGQRETVRARLHVSAVRSPDTLIDAAYGSRARLTVIPMQDLMALGSEARMNTPGTTVGNWRWRFAWADVPPRAARLSRVRAIQHKRLDGI